MRVSKLYTCLSAGSLAFAFGSVIYDGPIQKPLLAASQPSLSQPNEKRPWDAPPADDSYDNQIFFRLATLLQHWPNTRYPSGASIVPGTIPIGTTLYHGRSSTELPSRPDWLAFDPEHSALFTRGSSGRLFTFATTRPLRVLYFDGSSAAKLTSGAADTQDLLAWGHIGNQTFGDEQALINDLCKWGKPLGIDGYVRMEMSFEVMYCDFYQGIEVVSSLHILPPEKNHMPGGPPGKGPGGPPPSKEPNLPDRSSGLPPLTPTGTRPPHPRFPAEPRPSNWKGALLAMKQRSLEAFQAGAWHRRAPGEVRVRLDVARLVSLYDPALRSGMKTRKGLEKVQHRGKGLSQEDIETFRTWVIDSVQPTAPATSGVDWQALTTVIMDRYSSRLEYLQLLLKPDQTSANATAVVQDVRTELMIMLMPDLTSDTVPRSATRVTSSAAAQYSQLRRGEAWTDEYEWIKPILNHCSSYLVSHLPQDKFTREERTLYAGISGTLHEICRVLSLLWSEAYDPLPTTPPIILIRRWRVQVDELIQWLDWPMWNKCMPECDLDSICFIPTWPMGIGRGPGGKGEEDLTKVDWTPKCLHKKDKSW